MPPAHPRAALAARRPTLLVFSHLRWDFVFQRPQHLLTRAQADFDVVVLEEPLWEGGAELGVKERTTPEGIRIVQPTLPGGTSEAQAAAHQGAIVRRLAAEAAGAPLYYWYYTPMALAFSRPEDTGVTPDSVIFDKMDELSAFAGAPPILLQREADLLGMADVVFTGGASMHAAAAHRHANIHCFPSSIDAAHFGRARTRELPDPADQAGIAHPRLGFFGVIDERFDIALLRDTAALRPEWQFVMIGPFAKLDPATLPQGPNIHWLGGKSYAELPAYLAHWDVGLMPFAINDATRFISPTKTPEFLASGVPVVSTAITDVVTPYGDLGLVEIASTPEETVAAAGRLLNMPDRAGWLARVDAHLAGGSWDRTWSAMLGQIARVGKPAEPARRTLHIRLPAKESAHV